MAEIRIERKRRGLGWLWLLLALLVVAVLAWYFLYPGRTATPTPPAAAPPTTGSLDRAMPGGSVGTRELVAAAAAGIHGVQQPGGWYGTQG